MGRRIGAHGVEHFGIRRDMPLRQRKPLRGCLRKCRCAPSHHLAVSYYSIDGVSNLAPVVELVRIAFATDLRPKRTAFGPSTDRNRKPERGAGQLVFVNPQSSSVILDDRSADR